MNELSDLRTFSIDTPCEIAILGAGSWGTALANLLAANGNRIRLWARDASLIQSLHSQRENVRFLPGFPLHQNIAPTESLEEAIMGANVVLFAIPSGGIRVVARAVSPLISPAARIISASKGLEDGTGLRMSQVLGECLSNSEERLVVLSGPNLAVEIARGAPTASVAASVDLESAKEVQRLFTGQENPTFRVYTGCDVIGVELGGAIKNVIAIGAGICDGLGFGDNSKAALMTRGLTEAIRLGKVLGAEQETFLGLSGVGDLIATGGSGLSRNYRVGFALGQGRKLPEILSELGQVAEGVPTTHTLCDLAARNGVEMPLCVALHSALFEHRSPMAVIRELMSRPPKGEV